VKNYQLSLPGPSEVDPEVLQAMVRPNLPHYGDLWIEIYRGIINNLRKIYRTAGRVFVLLCSGSGAIDSVLCSLGARKGVVLGNGNFGSRLAEIARHHLGNLPVPLPEVSLRVAPASTPRSHSHPDRVASGPVRHRRKPTVPLKVRPGLRELHVQAKSRRGGIQEAAIWS
jgi:aspartate aminotransferase-like enzyme